MRCTLSLTSLCLALVLCGCGGGDGPSGNGASARADITVTAPVVSGTPRVGERVHFIGGDCRGGNGQFNVSWFYGDGHNDSVGSHVYTVPGTYTLTMGCSDTAGTPPVSATLRVDVAP